MVTGPAAVVYKHFEDLTDPRINRGKNHSLIEMIFLALTATVCGAQGWADVERFAKSKRKWFRQYVRLNNGGPSHDTFGRVFARLDTGQFLTAMHAWVDAFAGSLRGQGVAIDGKTFAVRSIGPLARRRCTRSRPSPVTCEFVCGKCQWTKKAMKSPPCPSC